jgi:hypothetical protein
LIIEIERFRRGSSCRSNELFHETLTHVPSLSVAILFFILGGRPATMRDSGEKIEYPN